MRQAIWKQIEWMLWLVFARRTAEMRREDEERARRRREQGLPERKRTWVAGG